MSKNNRKKILGVLLAFLYVQLGWSQVQDRPFPYYLSLTGTSQPEGIGEHITSTSPTGSDRYTEEGIVLTEGDTEFAFSGFYLKDVDFPSNFGIIVEFTYAMYDGKQYSSRYGDGLSLFLYDADKEFEIGAPGASLGYANKNKAPGYGTSEAGLNGAYLGIGLDVFGSYKLRSTNSGERREGAYGFDYKSLDEHITLRGGQFKNDRYKGYPVLASEQMPYGNESSPGVARILLDYDTGDYETSSYSSPSGLYSLRTSNYGYNLGYNTVTATLLPIDNGNGGMKVTVLAEDESRTRFKKPFTDFIYPNSFKTRDVDGNVYTFETRVPDDFRVGFAAGTGGATQTHIIKEVKINLPYAPETEDQVMLLCLTDHDDKTVYVSTESMFVNDKFYVGTVDNPSFTIGNRNVDLNSFRFEDENGFDITTAEYQDGNFLIKECEVPNVGIWEFALRNDIGSHRHYFSFVPLTDDLPEGDYTVYYSAHSIDSGDNGPFHEHVYRSRPTKFTVQARKCRSVVNPNLPIKVKMEDE